MTKIKQTKTKSKLKTKNSQNLIQEKAIFFDTKKDAKNSQKNSRKSAPFLDTLAQLQHQKCKQLVNNDLPKAGKGNNYEKNTDKKTLKKRAKSKHITNAYLYKLIDLNSPLKNSYWNTFHCSKVMIQEGKKITARYCNNRWCVTCNRIRTAKLINGYSSEFKKLDNPYFVTVTIPNVYDVDLEYTIDTMLVNFRKLTNYIGRRYRMGKMDKLLAIRKLEVTYNYIRNTYHPHFHIIVNGKENAEYIRKQWLKMYTDAKWIAQDVRKADINSMIELFKYTTKIITKNKKKGIGIHVYALDQIFQAMRNRRTFQPYGIRMVSEDVDEIESKEYTDIEEYESVIWEYEENDWYSHETGEELTGYTPGEFEKELKLSVK